jgi:predicted GNAT family acetyltransferase
MAEDNAISIQHREHGSHGEFFVEREGRRVAELTYSRSGERVVVGHTWVDPTLRGAGLAPALVEAAAQWARRGSVKIVPVCSYVRAVFQRSPGYADVWAR